MKIKYLGHSCFKITAKNGVSIITDPYTNVGYELPQGLTATIVTASHAHFDHNYLSAVRSENVVANVGEHTVNDVKITGIHSWHDEKNGALRGNNVIFKIEVDGVQVCHLGDLGEAISADLIKNIGAVDVLLIPVGGTYTIDAAHAKEYIVQIAPKVVIPMHFKPNDGKLDISPLSTFTNLFPAEIISQDGKNEVEFTKDNLPKSLSIICLEREKNE
jgi:L-ascorbate metabolism protein UlaG (beta-lactamase superfamily)